MFLCPSSGTGAWEAALTNTLAPGDKILASRFGQFSHLWIDMAQRLGFDVDVELLHRAPFGGDPLAVRVGNIVVALRRSMARLIEIETATVLAQ